MAYHIRQVSTGKYYQGDKKVKENDLHRHEPVFGKLIKSESYPTPEAGLSRIESIIKDRDYYNESIKAANELEVVLS